MRARLRCPVYLCVLASGSPVRVSKISCCIPLSSIKENSGWWRRDALQETHWLHPWPWMVWSWRVPVPAALMPTLGGLGTCADTTLADRMCSSSRTWWVLPTSRRRRWVPGRASDPPRLWTLWETESSHPATIPQPTLNGANPFTDFSLPNALAHMWVQRGPTVYDLNF